MAWESLFSQNKTNDGIFTQSVDNLSSDDIIANYEKDKKRSVLPLLMRSVVLALSFAIFSYSVFTIAERLSDDKSQEDVYNFVRPEDVTESALKKSNELAEPNGMLTLLGMLSANGNYSDYINETAPVNIEDYRKALLDVKAKNKDAYGWIVFRGTEKFTQNGINYPVMIGDNDYYLHHNYLGVETYAGSIFAEESLNRDHTANRNVLLYGHCMSNGSMFRAIKLWYDSANKNTLANDMQIEIYTEDALYVYKLFSSYRSDTFNFKEVYFTDNDDYMRFLKDIYKRSTLNRKMNFSADSRICTLVTCTNVKSNPDERYVVHGILDKVIPYE